jgi:hypothetical protein
MAGWWTSGSIGLNWLGDRMSEGWIRFKAERWRACADPEAVAGYAAMFARDGLPEPAARILCPLLAVTGEQDVEIMRSAAVTKFLAPLCDPLIVSPLADCGHYPMQEAPPLLVAIVERFLAGDATGGVRQTDHRLAEGRGQTSHGDANAVTTALSRGTLLIGRTCAEAVGALPARSALRIDGTGAARALDARVAAVIGGERGP